MGYYPSASQVPVRLGQSRLRADLWTGLQRPGVWPWAPPNQAGDHARSLAVWRRDRAAAGRAEISSSGGSWIRRRGSSRSALMGSAYARSRGLGDALERQYETAATG